MKRLRVILLFLLLGAVMNIAVAWAITLIIAPEIPSGRGLFLFGEGGSVIGNVFMGVNRRTKFGSQFYCSERLNFTTEYGPMTSVELQRKVKHLESLPISDVMPNWGVLDEFSEKINTGPIREQSVFEGRGWPRLSLWCIRVIILRNVIDNQQENYGSRGLIVTPLLPYEPGSPRILPLYPIWSGFLVNTLFYAAFLWLLIPGPFVLRRFIRLKRGLCPWCGHNLSGADHVACPECGIEIRKGQPRMNRLRVILLTLLLGCCALWVASYWYITWHGFDGRLILALRDGSFTIRILEHDPAISYGLVIHHS